MNRCNINLGREWILPARTRYRIYRCMQIYLTASGLLLIIAVYNASINIRKAAAYRHDARIIRDQFNQASGGHDSFLSYAEQLLDRIKTCTQQTQAVREALPSTLHTVLPLLNFLISQSGENSLDKLTMIQENDKAPVLEFSLIVPDDGRKNPGLGSLQNWQENADMATCFTSITPVTTLRGQFKNNDVFIVNYRAVFKESL